jgi:hypothetical protein
LQAVVLLTMGRTNPSRRRLLASLAGSAGGLALVGSASGNSSRRWGKPGLEITQCFTLDTFVEENGLLKLDITVLNHDDESHDFYAKLNAYPRTSSTVKTLDLTPNDAWSGTQLRIQSDDLSRYAFRTGIPLSWPSDIYALEVVLRENFEDRAFDTIDTAGTAISYDIDHSPACKAAMNRLNRDIQLRISSLTASWAGMFTDADVGDACYSDSGSATDDDGDESDGGWWGW